MYGIKLKNYDTFKCIADKCTNNCCSVGWIVYVDAESGKKYLEDPYVKSHLLKLESPVGSVTHSLKMDANKCYFLNENGFCNMVLERGEDYLCNTCKNYPRVKKLYGGNLFYILSLSCEAAITHLLKNQHPLEFEIQELDILPKTDDRFLVAANKFTNETNFQIFNVSMAILQNRDYELYQKIAYLYMMYQNIDELEKSDFQQANDDNVDTILGQYLENLQNAEIFEIIKNVKASESIFDKGSVIKALDAHFRGIISVIPTQNPSTLAKIKNTKNLLEYSDEEISAYNEKVTSFLRSNEIMIEKALILLMIQSTFPSNFEKLKDAMTYIILRIFIIQTTIISLNIETEDEITDEIFFESLRIITTAFEHDKLKVKELSEFVETQKPNFNILMNIIL